jgi:hypothetical protein
VGIDHLTHLWFEHDTSQILNRRAVLSDDELNLALAEADEAAPATAGDAAAPGVTQAEPRPEAAAMQEPRA